MKKKYWMALAAGVIAAAALGCGGTKAASSAAASKQAASKPAASSAVKEEAKVSGTKAKAKVYFTKDISPAGLLKVYKAMGWQPTGNVGVKISTGESQKSNHLRPELIKDIVAEVKGTIVECNTAYGGNRTKTANHWAAIKERGYLDIAKVDIMDEEGEMKLPAPEGAKWLKENIVGSHFKNYDSYLVLSHFKGHAMAGFGGALKNISIGFASSDGKMNIHSGGDRSNGWGTPQNQFLESMAEADKTIMNAMGDRIAFINVMNRISIDCDCDGNPAEPDIHDIGIAGSLDPVAVDQYCIDMVSKADGNQALMNRIKEKNATHILPAAEALGVGTREYEVVDLDK